MPPSTKQTDLGAFLGKRKAPETTEETDLPAKTKRKVSKNSEEPGEVETKDISSDPADQPSVETKADVTTTSNSTSATSGSPYANLEGMIPESWREPLKAEFTKPYWANLKKELVTRSAKETIFPPANKTFAALERCPFDKVRVVVIGQDPYHDDGQAEGLSFSVPQGIKVPSSLQNIYKELVTDIPGFKKPTHGHLAKWADQGVLLLNAALTVKAHEPNSHKALGWHLFTAAVIQAVASKKKGVVWMLWGNFVSLM